jgi:hypothetical protein
VEEANMNFDPESCKFILELLKRPISEDAEIKRLRSEVQALKAQLNELRRADEWRVVGGLLQKVAFEHRWRKYA